MKVKNSGGGFCVPRVKHGGRNPVTLLDRFRSAVLRLIMVSAVSHRRNRSPAATHRYYPEDPHHSEAVADCIEFINKKKKKASPESIDEAVIPVH